MADKTSGPISVAHAVATTQHYRKILVGYDGSENARRAIERAAALAAQIGASVRILVVASITIPVYGPQAPMYPQNFVDDVIEESEKSLGEAIAIVKVATQNVTGSVERGHASDMILVVAENEGADLIVIGRRGLSGIERFLMGGVSSSVVNHSKCDVLVVK